MQYIKLERANIEISKIAFGAQRFENAKNHEEHVETILHAYKKGINFFDTAVLYCEDQSEIILGKAIKEMKKGDLPFYISSKCLDGDHNNFRKRLETSLKRLNLDSLDFFTCFWGVKSFLDWEGVKSFGALKEMEKAKEEGLIKHICITTHMKNEDLKKVVKDYPFDINIVGYNLINSKARIDGLKASYESGISNISMNPLGTGIIPQFKEVFDVIKIRENQTLVQAAYDYLLSNPYIHSVLGGFSNKKHVDDAVFALENHVPYSKEEIQLIDKKVRKKINTIPLEKRYEIAMELCKKMYILRDEVAEFMNVYPMRIW
ncbi:aldo/keto reductase [Clostridium oceanicum]|uniref:Aldo/keto reductase n=1 Tax=Clostridium oceanicum TaxID=1543 RepID=A0ABN1J9G0_9CLOT